MENFQFGEAVRRIYEFLWGEYCDWYIEIAKVRLRSDGAKVPSPVPVLVHVLGTSLRLLHPYMPFVTEVLWWHLQSALPPERRGSESIMVAAYPEADKGAIDPEVERVMASTIEIIRAIRNARAQYKVESGKWIEAQIYTGELKSAIAACQATIQTLARIKLVAVVDGRLEAIPPEKALVLVLSETEVVIPMETMVDVAAERACFEQELGKLQVEVTRLEARLKDRAFLSSAPSAIVDKERARLAQRKDRLDRLGEQLGRFSA
jgi:valyl-tRNA synthetase